MKNFYKKFRVPLLIMFFSCMYFLCGIGFVTVLCVLTRVLCP